MARLNHLNKLYTADFDCFVFDKDGTLIDAHFYWVQMIKLRATEIAKLFFKSSPQVILNLSSVMGVDKNGDRLRPEGPVGIKPRSFIVETVRSECEKLGLALSSEEVESIFKKIDEKSAEDILPFLRLLPGCYAFLESAHKLNVKLAMATTDLTSRAELALKALNLFDYFSLVVGVDQVKKSKPDGEMGLLISNRLGIPVSKIAMFGDHDVDINMARASGYGMAIGVETGLNGSSFSSHPDILSINFEALGVTR